VLFIEITLVLAGVIFMMVQGVNDSTRFTFGPKLTGIHNYQITLSFDQPQRLSQISNLALADPAIQVAEPWLVLGASARPEGQTEKQVTDARLQVFGLPADTGMYKPDLASGRWLLPEDERAALVTSRLAAQSGWSVGDWIVLTDPSGRESRYQLVGVTYDPLLSSAAFVPLKTLQRQTGLTGQANTLWAQTRPQETGAGEAGAQEAENLQAIALRLSESFDGRGISVSPQSTFRDPTITQIVESFQGGFSLIIQLLAIMAVIIAVVGGVGLSGVISLNVLERRREIGVMRSIGASDRRVLWMFIGEGLLLGWISWLVALPLSVPAAELMSTVGLSASLNQQLTYSFTPFGALAWLLIISLMAVVASALPARGAARLSVRESLAYQ
jgi:putative ABC transport system permease protein